MFKKCGGLHQNKERKMCVKYIVIFKDDSLSEPRSFDEAMEIWHSKEDECKFLTAILEKK